MKNLATALLIAVIIFGGVVGLAALLINGSNAVATEQQQNPVTTEYRVGTFIFETDLPNGDRCYRNSASGGGLSCVKATP